MTAQAESGRATQSNALPVELATQMSMITPATRTWPPGFDTTLDAVEQACPSPGAVGDNSGPYPQDTQPGPRRETRIGPRSSTRARWLRPNCRLSQRCGSDCASRCPRYLMNPERPAVDHGMPARYPAP